MDVEPNYAANLAGVLPDLAEARRYNEWLFSRARPNLGRRVLDAGAGIGTFTELAADAADEVVAVEPDPQFAAELERRFAGRDDITVVQTAIDEFTGESAFDSVLCLNVLEHVGRDGEALQRMAASLRSGGKLLLLVPAHPALYGAYDRATGHARRYTRSGLRTELERAGLKIDELRYVNPIGAAGWFLRIRLARGDAWPGRSAAAFERIVPLARALDGVRLPFGLSLWAVASAP